VTQQPRPLLWHRRSTGLPSRPRAGRWGAWPAPLGGGRRVAPQRANAPGQRAHPGDIPCLFRAAGIGTVLHRWTGSPPPARLPPPAYRTSGRRLPESPRTPSTDRELSHGIGSGGNPHGQAAARCWPVVARRSYGQACARTRPWWCRRRLRIMGPTLGGGSGPLGAGQALRVEA
jgi:hypothetical protein